FTLTSAKVAAILAVFLFTWIFLVFLRKALLNKKNMNIGESGRRISLMHLIRYLAWVIAISASIRIAGINVTFLVAGSAALLVGIGFGLQNIFSDLISGLFMLFERKVRVGDVMEVENIVGKVKTINLRTSVLLTRDGYDIIVPNHKFITENVINWSHHSYDRRFQIDVGVSYNSDIDLVTKILLDCCQGQSELIDEPPHEPTVRFDNFGDSALLFFLLFWTKDIFHVEQIKSDLRYKIFKAFRENNISIPFPQRDVHIIPQS
ncbi:MAG TPA: mechanosensitive ion channel, partial [Chitinophagaceae bacterium]|nr:mechanosensitive ion channel [Chitinophagaceae bacterium]